MRSVDSALALAARQRAHLDVLKRLPLALAEEVESGPKLSLGRAFLDGRKTLRGEDVEKGVVLLELDHL